MWNHGKRYLQHAERKRGYGVSEEGRVAGSEACARRLVVPDAEAAGGSRRPVVVFVCMMAALAAAAALNLRIGSVDASWQQIAAVISGRDDSGLIYNIIMQLRIPRMCAAALLGGALAISGFLLQTYFNNPIAGPFVLGISSGSKMAVAAVMIIFSGMAGAGARQTGEGTAADAMNAIFASARGMSSAILIIAAFAGAMLSMGIILLISRVIQNMYMLVVGGIMIGYICTAVTDFMVTFADDSNIVNLHNWSLGSFSGITWDNVRVIAAVVIPAAVLVFMMSKQISAFLLGEDYAQSMGVEPRRFKAAVILLSSLLSACVTAYAGPVSFVGIAVPHIVKRTLGTARPILVIPACFLCGAVFCLGCDLLARTAFAPSEVNISSVTAVFGAPVVLYVLIKRRRVQ